jgi:lysophospholipase L1-like esterase
MSPSFTSSLKGAVQAFVVVLIALGAANPAGAQAQRVQQPEQAQPAAVPKAVQIPRPSDQEIATAERSLAAFVGSADQATRTVLDRYPSLLEVRPPRVNTAIIPNLSGRFEAKHQDNLGVARAGDIELLLMGDSITDFWRNSEGNFAGKSVLDEYFGHWKIANFGIAGDTTQGVLYRLQNGEGTGFSPKAVMLMIGTNNTAQNNAAEIAEGIGAVVLELRSRFPSAKILLLGVFPRGRAADPVRGTIADINAAISKLHDGSTVQYFDIGDAFLDDNGDIPTEVMSDGLHPSTEGYRRWAQAVREPLSALMK